MAGEALGILDVSVPQATRYLSEGGIAVPASCDVAVGDNHLGVSENKGYLSLGSL